MESTRWSIRSASDPNPSSLNPLVREMSQKGERFGLGDIQLIRGQQSFAGVMVEGGWMQSLVNSRGEIQYEVAQVVEGLDSGLAKRVANLQVEAHQLLQRTRRQYPDLATAAWQSAPEIILRKEFNHYAPFLRVSYLIRDETEVREIWVNTQGRVRYHYRQVGAHAVQGLALVFPTHPRESMLTEQILYNLVGDGTLNGEFIRTLSAREDRPFSLANEFKYQPTEPAFDEVQAYYYADQQVRWFKDVLDLNLRRTLELKLHVGAPQPSSAMFYYQGQIRLGDGDGVAWKNIPRDPSIVKHEVGHAFVELLAGLPSQGEGGSYNEAFSDFFYANAAQEPYMGSYSYLRGPFRRNLENAFLAYKDFNGGLYNDSLVISGTFWDIQKSIGPTKAALLAKDFLMRLGPGGRFADFVPVMEDAVKVSLTPEEGKKVLDVVRGRGWTPR